MSKCDAQELRIKTEPDWDEGTSSEDTRPLLTEYIVTQTAVQVKEEEDYIEEEPECWEEEAGLHGISAAAARAGLYANHVVKDELVLGPEGVQPADVVFTLHAARVLSERDQLVLRDCSEQTYTCDICKKTFHLKTQLVDHIMIHIQRSAEQGERRRGVGAVQVKEEEDYIEEESECSDEEAGLRGVSAAAARAGLYANHVVKDELVLGPEGVQPADAAFTLPERTQQKFQTILLKSQKSGFFVGDDLTNEEIKIDVEQTASVTDANVAHKCSFCSYASKFKSQLLCHERKHTGEKPYKCEHCSYASARKSRLLVHEIKHTGQKPYKCRYCSFASGKKSLLRIHETKHTGGKPYKCSQCSFASALKCHLLVHERKHTGEKPYKCSYCSFASGNKKNVRVHEKKHTGEEQPYKCGHCSFATDGKSNLLRHERKHTGEKPYKCTHCSFASGDKSVLRVHERKHTGEKPYKCRYCSHACAQKTNLLTHERKHTGEKPYKCSHCSFATAQRTSLVVHERRHTGQKP